VAVARDKDLGQSHHVVLYSDCTDRAFSLEVRLRQKGFRLTNAETLDSLIGICNNKKPDVLIIRSYSLPRDLIKTLKQLLNKGLNLSKFPTFLQVRGNIVQFLAPLLDIGFEEIGELDADVEEFATKIKAVCDRTSPHVEKPSTQPKRRSVSRGNLSDFSIIDLLQALGPSQRTVKITVRSDDATSEPLLLYLLKGQISYAKLGELLAEKAIYKALTWESGTWISEPMNDGELPEANSNLPNEFILMEGCRLIDENARQAELG
jgi:hypothetical protein